MLAQVGAVFSSYKRMENCYLGVEMTMDNWLPVGSQTCPKSPLGANMSCALPQKATSWLGDGANMAIVDLVL